jgi:hypothetical protein
MLAVQAKMWGQRPSDLIGLSADPVIALVLDDALFYRVTRLAEQAQRPGAPAGMSYESLGDLEWPAEPAGFEADRQREIAERWGPH